MGVSLLQYIDGGEFATVHGWQICYQSGSDWPLNGTFSDLISVHNLIPVFVSFGPNLTHFGANWDIPSQLFSQLFT